MLKKSTIYYIKVFKLGIIVMSFLLIASQDDKTKPREVRKMFKDAEKLFYDNNYVEALSKYNELLKIDPEDSTYFYYRIGQCHIFHPINVKEGLKYLKTIEPAIIGTDEADLLYYSIGLGYFLIEKYDSAEYYFYNAKELNKNTGELLPFIDKKLEEINAAKVLPPGIFSPFKIYPISSYEKTPINTFYPEYRPIIPSDFSFVLITSRNPIYSKKTTPEGLGDEVLLLYKRDKFGRLKFDLDMRTILETRKHLATSGSISGKAIYIIYKGEKGGDLYFTKLVDGQWMPPEKLPPPINSDYWETSAFITEDGKSIYFISDRPGGYGGRDVWFSISQDGKWLPPENAGPSVNTSFEEESPFVISDTLFFASQGHNSIGGYDIFYSVIKENYFTPAINVGPPISSPFDEAHFLITPDRRIAVFTSNRINTNGSYDVFVAYLVPPPNYAILSGNTNYPLDGLQNTITLIDEEGNKIENIYFKKGASNFICLLEKGKKYSFLVQKKGSQTFLSEVEVPPNSSLFAHFLQISINDLIYKNEKVGEEAVFSHINLPVNEEEYISFLSSLDTDFLSNHLSYLIELSEKKEQEIYKENPQAFFAKDTEIISASLPYLAFSDTLSNFFIPIFEEKNLISSLSSSSIFFNSDYKEKLQKIKIGNQEIAYVPPSTIIGVHPSELEKIVAATAREEKYPPPPIAGESKPIEEKLTSPYKQEIPTISHLNEIQKIIIPFSYKSSKIPKAYLDTLELIAKVANEKNLRINIYGYGYEYKSNRSNKNISLQRGIAVKNNLIRNKVKQENIEIYAMGNTNPLLPPTTTKNKAANNRVEIFILPSFPDTAIFATGPLHKGQKIIVLFNFDSYYLSRDYRDTLTALAKKIKAYNHSIKIEGHTDDIGSTKYNLRLSVKRAHSVASFLKKYDVKILSKNITGHGEKQPRMPNTSIENRKLNRRVEIIIEN